MGRNTKTIQGKNAETVRHSAPTLEEILAEIEQAKPKTGYTSLQLGNMFGRSTGWVMRRLVRGGYFEFAGQITTLNVANRNCSTFIYKLTQKGKRELRDFIKANGI